MVGALEISGIISAVASSITAVAVALQVSHQRKFLQDQARRDAHAKISEAWQRFTDRLSTNEEIAGRFWRAEDYWPDADHGQRKVIFGYVFFLNTIQQEFRYATTGLHNMKNFDQTLRRFIQNIYLEGEISCLRRLADTLGFDTAFVQKVIIFCDERSSQLRGQSGASKAA